MVCISRLLTVRTGHIIWGTQCKIKTPCLKVFNSFKMWIKPVNPKGNQSWICIGRTDAEAETPILWPPDAKSRLIWKDPDAGKHWGREEKGTTEDEIVGWHHQLNGHGFGWTPGVGDGQGGLACCNSWDRKELDTTEWMNWYKNSNDHWPQE